MNILLKCHKNLSEVQVVPSLNLVHSFTPSWWLVLVIFNSLLVSAEFRLPGHPATVLYSREASIPLLHCNRDCRAEQQ